MQNDEIAAKKEELKELRNLIGELFDDQFTDISEDGSKKNREDEVISIRQWKYNILDSLYEYEPDEEVETLVSDKHLEFEIEASVEVSNEKTRTYRAHVFLDSSFSDTAKDKVKAALGLMITKMVRRQVKNFKKYAEPTRNGLRYRRAKSKPFPHTLPYMNPPASNIQEQIIEEAGVVEAAVYFAFNSTSPKDSIKLYIDSYTTDIDIKGKAVVNYYNEHYNEQKENQELRITLNEKALSDDGSENKVWAGRIAHEILHNLGWQHPDDEYTLAMPIEIYQACISDGNHFIPPTRG